MATEMSSTQREGSNSEMVHEQRPIMSADLLLVAIKAMAMEMSSSQCEMVHEQRPVMSADLFLAAIKGDEDVLIQRLGLPTEQEEVTVTIEASHSAPEKIKTEHQTAQFELQSATRFGDTVLHLLVTKRHNELALKVFQREMSLLMAQNKKLEMPLHYAAKVGNKAVIQNFIRTDLAIVKDALQKTNENGDTALHVAVKHRHRDVVLELMKLDLEATYKVNNESLSPFHIAIVSKHYTNMVQKMLEVDRTLACTQFLNGMFPVHVAAQMGHRLLVLHFMEKYPDDAKLLDSCGRNFFHIAAEENHGEFFWDAFKDTSVAEMIARMIHAEDYEGNTPEDIALMKKHVSVVKAIRNIRRVPLGYLKYIVETDDETLENKWERSQLVGLGSVLITTVTFAAGFTIPGGYNQEDGTPVLGRRYMFGAFILANALSFIQGFVSLFALLINALPGVPIATVEFAIIFFLLAASSMVVAFGLGLYVTLAPVCLPIAILLLVITLFLGSPALFFVFAWRTTYIQMVTVFFGSERTILAAYIVPLMLIFSLALLYLR